MSHACASLSRVAVASQAARAAPLRAARACSRVGLRTGAPALGAAASRAAVRSRSGVAARAEQGSEPASPDEKPAGRPPVRAKARPQPKVQVSAPAVDRALSDAPPTEAAKNETSALLALTLVFLAIIVEGLLVASSGFMSEEWDGIVQNNVLPVFAPTLGLFLLGSSAYGVWKTYSSPK